MSTPAAIPEAGIAATVDEDELDDAFEAAAAFVVAVASSTKLNDEDALRIYGLYKQATEGACTSSRPGFWEQKKRRKWEAWAILGSQTESEAKHQYVATVTELFPDWIPDTDKQQSQPAGPVVSSLAGADKQEMDPTSLLDAASFGDHAIVRQLLQEGAAVDQRDETGCTALHYAADRGHLQAAAALLEGGAAVEARDQDEQTPLHCAALSEHELVYKLLLQHGAQPSCQDDAGQAAQWPSEPG